MFTYAWQHFRAIEYGYQIESAKRELNDLTEMNRALRLEDAILRDPERIDVMARRWDWFRRNRDRWSAWIALRRIRMGR